jgi:UDP-glucose 4-epimerase
MKRVLITGATGFVGANLSRRLLYDGHEIHLLVRPDHITWRLEAIRPHVCLHKVDLQNASMLTQVITQIRPDWVFHLAAYGAYSSQVEIGRIIQTNFIGTVNLVEACLKTGFDVFINTGSSSEYGFKDYPPSEKDWLEPNSHYAVSKASATLYCRYIAQSCGVHLPTLRLYSVYGPYEEPTRLLPTLILKGMQGQFPPLVNPEIARDFIYVDDVEEVYLLAAIQPKQEVGAVYNVGTGIQTPLWKIVEMARQMFKISAEPIWGSMPNRHWDTKVWVANNNKIKAELGWEPRHTLEQGFGQMVNWFYDNPGMRHFYTSVIEATQ